jgi:hypothetical protein
MSPRSMPLTLGTPLASVASAASPLARGAPGARPGGWERPGRPARARSGVSAGNKGHGKPMYHKVSRGLLNDSPVLKDPRRQNVADPTEKGNSVKVPSRRGFQRPAEPGRNPRCADDALRHNGLPVATRQGRVSGIGGNGLTVWGVRIKVPLRGADSAAPRDRDRTVELRATPLSGAAKLDKSGQRVWITRNLRKSESLIVLGGGRSWLLGRTRS